MSLDCNKGDLVAYQEELSNSEDGLKVQQITQQGVESVIGSF